MRGRLDYQQILNDLATAGMIVDTRGRVIFFNAEAERLTGITRQEALGRACTEVFRTPLCPRHCRFDEAGQGRLARFRTRILTTHERQLAVDVRTMVVRDQAGQVIGRFDSFVDDSARDALETRLKQAQTLDNVVGQDPAITALFEMLPVVAASDASILVLGETGCGKDLLARAIHNISARRHGPFIKVNCAALPGNLLESELFGYKRGAFTDARRDKAGRFQLAEGGTIFLDEIGELPKDLQANLLQVLDEQEFYPLGSTRPVRVDVRVIASTNRDLAAMTLERAFRRDLYYRLKVVEVALPPLRERGGDIPLLIEHFVGERAAHLGKDAPVIEPAAMKILLNYGYPGNVRELRNIAEHAVLLSHEGVIRREDLPHYLLEDPAPARVAPRPAALPADPFAAKEREALLEALTASRWHLGQTAAALHVARTTLWRKMKRYGLAKVRPPR
jgi:PAS domain S-box-containing protein